MTTALLAPPITDATRREFLAALAAAGLLAGCSNDAGSGPPATTTRTVTHQFGTTEVPLDPRRVVVYDSSFTLAGLLQVGVTPVAAAGFQGYADGRPFSPAIPQNLTTGIEVLDFLTEIDVEQIAALRPDLIIGGFADEPVFRRLAGIAPAVQFEFLDTDSYFADLAAALGRTDRWQQLLAELDAEVDAAAAAPGSLGTISFASLYDDSIEIWDSGTTLAANIAQRLGATVLPDLGPLREDPSDPTERVTVSPERLGDLQGDRLVLLQVAENAEEAAGLAAYQDGPLYARLPAVVARQVLVVDRGTANGVGGIWGYRETFAAVRRFLGR